MGGRSSSKTASTTNTDNRQLAVQDGVGVFTDSGDTTVTLTDLGAIDRSLATADNALNKSLMTVDSNSTRAFDFGKTLQDEVGGTIRDAFGLVNESFRGVQKLASNSVRGESGEVADTSQALIYVIGGVAALGLIYAIAKGMK